MVRTAVESERAYGHGSVSGSLAEAAHHLPVARLQGPDATDLHPEKLPPPDATIYGPRPLSAARSASVDDLAF